MRTCSRCGEEKSLEEFPERKLGTGQRRGHCRACKARYQSEWYEKNKERHKRAVARIRKANIQANQRLVRAAKARPCLDCGERFPYYVMDLDHVRGTKVDNISRMVSYATQDAVRVEIEKCDPVCANCHRERTFGPDAPRPSRRSSRLESVETDGVGDEGQLDVGFETAGPWRR